MHPSETAESNVCGNNNRKSGESGLVGFGACKLAFYKQGHHRQHCWAVVFGQNNPPPPLPSPPLVPSTTCLCKDNVCFCSSLWTRNSLFNKTNYFSVQREQRANGKELKFHQWMLPTYTTAWQYGSANGRECKIATRFGCFCQTEAAGQNKRKIK